LARAVTIRDDQPRRRRRCRRLTPLLLVGALVGAACSGRAGIETSTTRPDQSPNSAPPPTLAGGVELAAVDLSRVLVGDGLAFGTPLPSEQVAADLFTEDPEVASAIARRVYSLADGRRLGDLVVLTLEGAEIFDQTVLDAFVRGVVAGLGGGDETDGEVAGRTVFRAQGDVGAAVGFLEGDQLVLLRGVDAAALDVVVERQLAAIAAGAIGSTDPVTPLVPLPSEAAFVTVPTVEFQPIPPPDEEPAPEAPTFAGTTGVQGRYGVVAGERRTTVWAFTVDGGTYPSAEALTPALAALASSRAGGAPTEAVEEIDRVVQRATGAAGSLSAAAFRHEGLVLLVEGADAAQVAAVVSAWIAVLSAT
jgi:hypothetical protein